MQTSRDISARRATLGLLLVVNAIMFLACPLLRTLPTGSDDLGDLFTKGTNGVPQVRSARILPNDDFLRWFLDATHTEKNFLFLGTSETTYACNLPAQLNHLTPNDPQMAILAAGGLSPIHSTLLLARIQQKQIKLPPTVLAINLVYCMNSHDLINDSWLTRVMRSPVFFQMNHGNIRASLSQDVRTAYDRHFAGKAPLYPLWMQQYVGYLLYLSCHQDLSITATPLPLPKRTFAFDGVAPEYDKDRGVHVGYAPSDQAAKWRWEVRDVADSVNVKGMASALAILRKQPAPVLVLVLPMNRRFYEYNGSDMGQFDEKYRRIRDEIRSMAQAPHLILLDLYDSPTLDMGFLDRMHADAHGNYQLAQYLMQADEYTAFLKAADEYYSTATSQKNPATHAAHLQRVPRSKDD